MRLRVGKNPNIIAMCTNADIIAMCKLAFDKRDLENLIKIT